MKTFISSVFAFMLLATTITAGGHKIIQGKVVDSSTGKGISYASITLSGCKISNITNSEGNFEIKLPEDKVNDTLKIDFVGYKSVSASVGKIKKSNVIKLEKADAEQTMSLGEALYNKGIRPDEANIMVKTAFQLVRDNYCTDGCGMTAFYRESIKREGLCVGVNEAIINIDKSPYCSLKQDKAGIFKGRKNYDALTSDNMEIKLQGGVNDALDIDIVKSPFLGTELKEIDDIYSFSFAEPVFIGDRFNFVVEFKPKENRNGNYFAGKIYIDYKTNAISRAEFGRPKNLSYDYILDRPSKIKLAIESTKYTVSYKFTNGKWFLDHSRTELILNSKNRETGKENRYVVNTELAVNNMQKEHFDIDNISKLKANSKLSDKINHFSDTNFWENYNTIAPDYSLVALTNRIAQNQTTIKK